MELGLHRRPSCDYSRWEQKITITPDRERNGEFLMESLEAVGFPLFASKANYIRK